jgi:ATP-dependent Lhr-like helicase
MGTTLLPRVVAEIERGGSTLLFTNTRSQAEVWYQAVLEAIEEGESAIVFTNTRSQTEIWYQAILAARPDWAGTIALHHGSLDRGRREWVENGLRDGRLRCVVATSSLDLGVDFSPVDRVLQIGSPKGVARLLQRAGRSGHRPGAVSRVTCVPTNALELLEVAAARDGVEQTAIESRLPVERPLDVLAQHVVTVALGGGFASEALLAEVRSTRAYADLRDDEWEWVIAFLTNGGDALRAYPEYSRIVLSNGRYVVESSEIARRHRMSIGTIVGDAQIGVFYLRGGSLGTVEESFVARL